MKTQNKLTLSHNYFNNTLWIGSPHYNEGKMPWRNKKFPPVLTAQSSITVKAVAKEPTN